MNPTSVISKSGVSVRRIAYYTLFAYVTFSPLIRLSVPGGYLTTVEILLAPSLMLLLVISIHTKYLFKVEILALLGYIGIIFLSQLYVPKSHITETLFRSIRYVAIFVPLLLSQAIRLRDKETSTLFIFAMFSLGVSILIGSIGFVMGWDAFLSNKTYYYGEVLTKRAGGVFRDSGQFGFAIGIWFTIIWTYYSKHKITSKLIIIYILIILILLFSVYASLSRVALLMISLTLLVSTTMAGNFKINELRRYWIAVTIILLMVPLTKYFKNINIYIIYNRIINTLNKLTISPDAALSGRLSIWSGYLPLLRQSPLVGIGYKSLILAHSSPPDNSYLGALVETGVLGAGLFYLFIFFILLQLFKYSRISGGPWWKLAAFSMWLGSAIAGLTADVFTYWGVMPVLLALVGGVLYPGEKSGERSER